MMVAASAAESVFLNAVCDVNGGAVYYTYQDGV